MDEMEVAHRKDSRRQSLMRSIQDHMRALHDLGPMSNQLTDLMAALDAQITKEHDRIVRRWN